MHINSLVREHFFGLIYFGGQESRAPVVRVIIQHQNSMLLLDGGHVRTLPDSQDQLRLPSIHCGIESTWVHAQWIDKFALPDISIHAKSTLDC